MLYIVGFSKSFRGSKTLGDNLKNYIYLICASILFFSITACQSESEKSCFEQGNLRDCTYLCHQGNSGACALEEPLGQEKCLEQGSMEGCIQLCYTSELNGSHPPAEPYCNKIESLCLQEHYRDHEQCQLNAEP